MSMVSIRSHQLIQYFSKIGCTRTAFLKTLDEIAETMKADPGPVVETRMLLEKLVIRMDAVESSFDRVVERSREFHHMGFVSLKM